MNPQLALGAPVSHPQLDQQPVGNRIFALRLGWRPVPFSVPSGGAGHAVFPQRLHHHRPSPRPSPPAILQGLGASHQH